LSDRALHSFPPRRSSDLRLAVESASLRWASVPNQLHFVEGNRYRAGLADLYGAEFVAPQSLRPKFGAGNLQLRHSPPVRIESSKSEEHTSELQSRGHLVC